MQNYDNEHQLSKVTLPSGSNAPYFLESTLPYYPYVISENKKRSFDGPEGPTPLVIDQSYWILSYDRSNGELLKSYMEHKDFSSERSYKKMSDEPKPEEVYQGSGGNYLSNEIFYRTAKVRKNSRPSLPTGHLHIPPVNTDPQSKGIGLISGVTTILKEFLKYSFSLTSSGEIAFADTLINSAGRVETLTVKNPADNTEAIEINSVEFSSPIFQLLTALPVSIQPGGSIPLQFKFVPTELKEYAGTATLKKADGTVLYIVDLKGKGIAPLLPKITSFSPTSGSDGTVITILGENLDGVTDVRIGESIYFDPVSPTRIDAYVTQGAFTSFIEVVTAAGTATSSTMFRVIRIREPYDPYNPYPSTY